MLCPEKTQSVEVPAILSPRTKVSPAENPFTWAHLRCRNLIRRVPSERGCRAPVPYIALAPSSWPSGAFIPPVGRSATMIDGGVRGNCTPEYKLHPFCHKPNLPPSLVYSHSYYVSLKPELSRNLGKSKNILNWWREFWKSSKVEKYQHINCFICPVVAPSSSIWHILIGIY